jgi:hypothetical protein
MGYDVIGDIHGQASKLEALLRKLGYVERAGALQGFAARHELARARGGASKPFSHGLGRVRVATNACFQEANPARDRSQRRAASEKLGGLVWVESSPSLQPGPVTDLAGSLSGRGEGCCSSLSCRSGWDRPPH